MIFKRIKKLWTLIKKIRSSKQVRDFFIGTCRQKLYDNPYTKWMLSKYLIRNYEMRKDQARGCLVNGECLHCGCETPDMFMVYDGCKLPENPCYPKILSLKTRLWQTMISVFNKDGNKFI